MKNRIIFSLFIAFGIIYNASAQYVSSVFYPDTTKSAVNRNAEKSVMYSNTINTTDLKKHLYTLASKEFAGRELGYEGNMKAGDYIASELVKMGAPMVPGQTTYFQPIALTYTSWKDNTIKIGDTDHRHLWDYLAFPNKNSDMSNLALDEVVFMGYGIEDKKYNDYKKANVKGKVIMINEGEPMINDSIYRISKSTEVSKWGKDTEEKLKVAKNHGATLVLIIVNDIKKMLGENRRFLMGPSVDMANTVGKAYDLPNHIYISSTMAKKIIGDNEKAIIEARNMITKNGSFKPVSLKTQMAINMVRKQTLVEGRNIAAYIEGTSKKDECIIVSAHYDHIGQKGDVVYYGADDNASGSTTLLELIEGYIQALKNGDQPKRSILFAWVTGEEKGLLGSNYYVEHPLIPLANSVANINIDMVGRRDKKYTDAGLESYSYVIGSDRLSTDLHKINEDVSQNYSNLICDYTYNSESDPNRYYFRSDHYNFAKKGIPAIFFFSGVHEDYHQPGDTPDKIMYEKMVSIGKHVFNLIWKLADREQRIVVDGIVK